MGLRVKEMTSESPNNKRVLHVAGTKGRTDALSLDKWFHNDFEKGHTDEYTVGAMDVGQVLLLQLHSDGGGWWHKNPDWFVNRISVISAKNSESYEFPCNRWVQNELKVFQGKGKNFLETSFPWLWFFCFPSLSFVLVMVSRESIGDFQWVLSILLTIRPLPFSVTNYMLS